MYNEKNESSRKEEISLNRLHNKEVSRVNETIEFKVDGKQWVLKFGTVSTAKNWLETIEKNIRLPVRN